MLEAEPGSRLVLTHFSPLMGGDDVPENYHTLRYELSDSGVGTSLSLTQDNNSSEEQAAQFSKNWQGMLDGLKQVVERG